MNNTQRNIAKAFQQEIESAKSWNAHELEVIRTAAACREQSAIRLAKDVAVAMADELHKEHSSIALFLMACGVE